METESNNKRHKTSESREPMILKPKDTQLPYDVHTILEKSIYSYGYLYTRSWYMQDPTLQAKVLSLYRKGLGILFEPVIGDFHEHVDELLDEYEKPNHGNTYARINSALRKSRMIGTEYYSRLADNITQIEHILSQSNDIQESK